MANDEHQIMADFVKQNGEFFELYKVHNFQVFRRNAKGEEYEVDIEVLDAGPDSNSRYFIIARSKTGKKASGNPHSNLLAALAMVHWQDLD